ncbi:flavodoxin [Methanomassiliicoccaceae archaeon DOK]|nr:flavodoxin [Methanomassiliicoccaceae archaeon DOK]
MSNVAVVYWSDTGNTEAMAKFVAEGIQSAGGSAEIITADNFGPDRVSAYDAIAFGCPAMGDEILEEDIFEPMFTAVEGLLFGKKVGIFGSYDWGDGQWMRDWADRCRAAGADLANDGVIANLYPNDTEAEDCRKLGAMMCS